MREPDIDWSRVTVFHLDEYIGLPPDHPASFRRYLCERFVVRVGPVEFVPVEGHAPAPGEIARLGALLAQAPVDVCFAGLGENCHVAFNDPPADFTTDDPFLVVTLDEACRRQQLGEGWFATLEDVPRTALSMSIRQIMPSTMPIVSVPEQRKAAAVRDGYAGCHPSSAMTAPDRLIERLDAAVGRPVLLITVAPELPSALAFIVRARSAGKLVAIGHSAAGPATIAKAATAGAAMSTHLGNGLPASLPKLDNTLMAQLAEDRLSASFIADDIHVPPHALKVMLRAKPGERSILVTDATAAAASPPGHYRFAGMTVERSADGTVRVPGMRSLAGSSLCLDAAVRNLVAWGLATSDQALRMASKHPRALLEPAMRAHGLDWNWGDVTWTEDCRPQHVRTTTEGEMA